MIISECVYLRLGEVDKAAFLLSEVLRGPLFVLPVTLILEHLNLIGAAEIISATGRDVWHGSLEITIQRHHSQLGSPLHTTTGYGNHSWRWHTVTITNTKKMQTKTNKLRRRRHYHLTYRRVRKRRYTDKKHVFRVRDSQEHVQQRQQCNSQRQVSTLTSGLSAAVSGVPAKQARSKRLCRYRPIIGRFDPPRRLAVMAAWTTAHD